MVEDEVYASIANIGESVMAPQEWGGSAATSKEFSKLADQIGTTVTPKGPSGHRTPCMAGLGMMIFKSARNPDAAWKWIEFLCRKSNMKKYVEATGQPARVSALTDPELEKIAPYFPALGNCLKIALGRAPIPEFIEFDTMVAEEVSNAITGVKAVGKALGDLNKRATDLMDKAGYYKKGTKKWWSESPQPGSDV
jgi:multiple sugar transport system substrate-binding protein